ncbi:phosphatidylinositol 3,4,5-trisphosphate 3-phosphatase TPTE2-like isoform X2 [Tachypleus tridentatus]|uniref:phosphatidylinositol 3,4,5-trisphosphate 3-phosphatase TPTE2-like isoform X2 n=2 Tax=Tachypleus tridentatus TaxID=6853 RepID=UPI003FD18833
MVFTLTTILENYKATMQKYTRFENDSIGVVETDHVDVQLKGSLNNSRDLKHTGINAVDGNKDGKVVVEISDPAGNVNRNMSFSFQHKLRKIVEHLAFRVFGLLLIIVDICVLIADLAQPNLPAQKQEAYDFTAMCFVCYFVVEVFLRIIAKGTKEFFHIWYNAVDFAVVIVAFVVTVVYTAIDIAGYAKLVVIGRLIRIVLFVRLFTERKHLEKGARHVVSQNKRRYQKDGFDLDLTYVTERVIAMSFPSTGKMSLYRNPIEEVGKFLDLKHSGHYKVYNLCSERTYDDTYFHGRVERIIIDDHNVPLLRDMTKYVKNVRSWLSEDKENVIAVHCKGGKGRTGTMICVWLVEAGLFDSAEASLDYFGNRRTDLSVGSKFQGVETPSQSRYVGYFQQIKEKYGGEPPADVPTMKIRQIKIYALAGVGKSNGSDFSCEIFLERNKVFDCNFGDCKNCQVEYQSEADVLLVTLLNSPDLSGDVKLRFQCTTKNVPRGYENCPFYFWFHTSFIENKRLYLTRDCLDNPHKPKTWRTFREKFAVELLFSTPGEEEEIPLN